MASIDKRNGKWRARWQTLEAASRSRAFRRKMDAERYLVMIAHSELVGGYVDPSAGELTLAEWWHRYKGRGSASASVTRRSGFMIALGRTRG